MDIRHLPAGAWERPQVPARLVGLVRSTAADNWRRRPSAHTLEEGLAVNTFKASDLKQFVAAVDAAGGPFSTEAVPLLQGMHYQPSRLPSPDLDPFSEAYVSAQMDIYREIALRDVDQEVTELTAFDMAKHVASPNPFASDDPSAFSLHYLRLAHAVANAKLPHSPTVLDMGCGWGVSSEFFATLGCQVVAVDINQEFVDLIKQRAQRHGLPINAERSSFENFETTAKFDAIVFYECLHHAIRPWLVIERMKQFLRPQGAIIFAGEPINNQWADWGLRLDPLSIYCIAKFGWFESGWSQRFITDCFTRAGLRPEFTSIPDKGIGHICVARMDPSPKPRPTAAQKTEFRNIVGSGEIPIDTLLRMTQARGWLYEPPYLISQGNVRLKAPKLDLGQHLVLQISNFRGRPIAAQIAVDGRKIAEIDLTPGTNEIALPAAVGEAEISMSSDTWVPRHELGSNDERILSFHLAGASILPAQ